MILYFSGTGNSLYVAKQLLAEGEALVSIAELMQKKEFKIELGDDEKLGIVFPVYFYTLPSIVEEFLSQAEIENAGYVYSVITCGGGTGQASAVLKKLLQSKGITLAYFKELLMPDNSMLFYQIPGTAKADGRLQAAVPVIDEVKAAIAEKETSRIKSSTVLSSIVGAGYKLCSSTKKFHAEDSCTGCGLCERNCPQQVIKMVETPGPDGQSSSRKPSWQKETCCKCSSCINRCPAQAIQYGKVTKKRNRYVNPLV